jgi:hypothetical protein
VDPAMILLYALRCFEQEDVAPYAEILTIFLKRFANSPDRYLREATYYSSEVLPVKYRADLLKSASDSENDPELKELLDELSKEAA